MREVVVFPLTTRGVGATSGGVAILMVAIVEEEELTVLVVIEEEEGEEEGAMGEAGDTLAAMEGPGLHSEGVDITANGLTSFELRDCALWLLYCGHLMDI